MKSGRKSTKKSQVLSKYTCLNELPIKIWFHCHKTGDLTKLLKDDIDLTDEIAIKLNEEWISLVNEWISRFDFSEEYKSSLKTEIEIANLQADYIITGKRHLLTFIKIEQEKLKMERKPVTEPEDLEIILAKISKHNGHRLISRDLMTDEYYAYLNTAIDG